MLESSLVAILNGSFHPVGAGILVSERQVLTCAHVVNDALGEPTLQETIPSIRKVFLRFHGSKVPTESVLEERGWIGPPAGRIKGADVCLLTLPSAPPSSILPARLAVIADLSREAFRAAGYPANWSGIDIAKGVIDGLDTNEFWILRPSSIAPRVLLRHPDRPVGQIAPGFSGSPVEACGRIVGMIVNVRAIHADATAYMMPVSHFPRSVTQPIEVYENRVVREFTHVREASSWIPAPKSDIDFDIRVRWCQSFKDASLVHRFRQPSSSYAEDDLSPQQFATNLAARSDHQGAQASRLVILAPGGSGKSSFLRKLMMTAPTAELVPFYLDFSLNKGPIDIETTDTQTLLQRWFANFHGRGSPKELLDLSFEARRSPNALVPLFIIDGFNQSKQKWDTVLERIGALAQGDLARAVIVIADRLIDRIGHRSFRRVAVLPLARSNFSEILENTPTLSNLVDKPNWHPLISSPLFLEILLEDGTAAGPQDEPKNTKPSRFAVLRHYFQEKCGLDDGALARIADASLAMYRQFSSTNFSRGEFEKSLDLADKHFNSLDLPSNLTLSDIFSRLDAHGVLTGTTDADIQFRHQILHDWFASLRLAICTLKEEPALLRASGFESLTLGAASADAPQLAIETVQSTPDLVRFLSRRAERLTERQLLAELYDWNTWITVQCVLDLERQDSSEPVIPPWMRHALYALSLEKKFDLFLYSTLRAGDIQDETSSLELSYSGSQTHEELINRVSRIVSQISTSESCKAPSLIHDCQNALDWIKLYKKETLDPETLDHIWRDPLLGWTTANLVQRLGANPAHCEHLIRLYRISRATSDDSSRAASFRWRTVHALGRGAPEIVGEFLLCVLADSQEDQHVRYGALRSTVQASTLSLSPHHLVNTFSRILELLPTLFESHAPVRIRHLLRRCCALNEESPQLTQALKNNLLQHYLDQYTEVLLAGKKLSLSLDRKIEADQWNAWLDAVEKIRSTEPNDGEKRREIFVGILETDKG